MNISERLFVLVVALFIPVFLFNSLASAQQPAYTISGTVRDLADQTTIPYVVIAVNDTSGSIYAGGGITDTSGNCIMPFASPGIYSVSASKHGYFDSSPQIVELTDVSPNKTVSPSMAQQRVSLPLSADWNFISFPRLPSNTAPIETVLKDISSSVKIVWGYDNAMKQWLKYLPKTQNSTPNTLDAVEFGKGYWINLKTSGSISLAEWPQPPDTTVQLDEGWNLAGYNGTDGAAADAVLSDIAGKWSILWNWKTGQWRVKSASSAADSLPSILKPFPGITAFNQGRAYWIRAKEGLTWDQIEPPSFITVGEGTLGYKQFYLGSTPWFPYGQNYNPFYALQFPMSYPEYWLGAYYNGDSIEADLRMMSSLGVNCITIQGSLYLTAPSNLADFLDRCRRNNIKVILAFPKANMMVPFPIEGPPIPQLNPQYLDPETALDTIIPALNLANRDEVMAYHIAWEPSLGLWNGGRSAWDGVWSNFIDREFGTPAAPGRPAVNPVSDASAAFGIPLVQQTDLNQHPADSSPNYQDPAWGVVSYTLPVRTKPGNIYPCNIRARNMGRALWQNGTVSLVKVFGQGLPDEHIHFIGDGVEPMQDVSFNFTYTAPSNPGRYRLRLGMFMRNESGTSNPFGGIFEWEVEVAASGAEVTRTIAAPIPVFGPSDKDLKPPADPSANYKAHYLVNAFRRSIDTETSTRFGRVTRRIRQMDPNHLISADQGKDGNGNLYEVKFYPLELYSTAFHFDYLGVENYYINRDNVPDDILGGVATIYSYGRWAGKGKPIIWTEEGYQYQAADPADQGTYHGTFINAMLQTNGNGIQFWWWPGGERIVPDGSLKDWGFVDPAYSNPRPSAFVLNQLKDKARSPRTIPTQAVTGLIDPMITPQGFAGIFALHRQDALNAVKAGSRYVMEGIGESTQSDQKPAMLGGLPKYLWAEISKVELKAGAGGDWFEVRNGMAYAVPAGTAIYARARVVNMGDTTWLSNVALSGNLKGDDYLAFPSQYVSSPVSRMTMAEFNPFLLTSGIAADNPLQAVQFQMIAEGTGWESVWITGSVRVHLAVYP